MKNSSWVNKRIGNYSIVGQLGQGGFAEVYLGKHIYLHTYAAIKVLHAQLSQNEAEHFYSEARIVAHLVHPHIVRVLDFGIQDDTPFLVMDYASNGTLRQCYPKGTQLPLSDIVHYVKQVADALQFAHEQKIIHRDIKPENMLLDRDRRLLLSDFGIALLVQSSHYHSIQEIAGTVAYMAPEQIQSHPRSASDQYSLGVVVYEWLCGERPFSGSFSEVAIKHTVTPPQPLRERILTLSPTVEHVVLRALAKEPNERFETIRDFALALEQASQENLQTMAFGKPLSFFPLSPRNLNTTLDQEIPSERVSSSVEPIDQLEKAFLTTNTTSTSTEIAEISKVSKAHSLSEKTRVWKIDRNQLIAMIAGTLLYIGLIALVDILVQHLAFLNNRFNDSLFYYLAFGNILYFFCRLVPLFAGAAYGPWVALSISLIGGVGGDLIGAHGFVWWWPLGGSITALGAGLIFVRTGGNYHTKQSRVEATILAALVEAIGLIIPTFGTIWILHISWLDATQSYLVETLPCLIIIFIFLPLLLLLYDRYVTHVSQKKS